MSRRTEQRMTGEQDSGPAALATTFCCTCCWASTPDRAFPITQGHNMVTAETRYFWEWQQRLDRTSEERRWLLNGITGWVTEDSSHPFEIWRPEGQEPRRREELQTKNSFLTEHCLIYVFLSTKYKKKARKGCFGLSHKASTIVQKQQLWP